MLGSMPGPTLTEWMAFDRIEVPTTDRLLAQLCALFYNANRGERARALAPEDFLGRPRRKRDPGDVVRAVKGMMRLFGGRS